MATALRTSDLQVITRDISECFSEADALSIPNGRPTPLIGRWADESWPLNSRQASEMVLEAVSRQRSSLVFEDAAGNEFTYGDDEPAEDEVDDLHSNAEQNSELAEEMSAQHSTDDVLESPTHVARCFKFDPYNISEGVDVIYCCYCDICTAMYNTAPSPAHQAVESVHAVNGPAPPRGLGASPPTGNSSMASSPAQNFYQTPAPPRSEEWDTPRPSGFATHLTSRTVAVPPPIHHVPATALQQPATGPLLSSFMPPPPPPRIMTLVLDEEGNRSASTMYYHVLTRWYNHVIEAQEFFMAPEDYCPVPNKELYSFDEWADRVSGWWYTHFEHRQKKQVRFPTLRRQF